MAGSCKGEGHAKNLGTIEVRVGTWTDGPGQRLRARKAWVDGL
jgi:hypothetical protein